ncbi:MAG TPA: Ku protein [Gaiellaceae bacterium]|jgi:DNA end-binding protein Ku
MRTNWNGSISFGLVNIPIGLVLATEAKAKASDVAFKTLHRECGTPIKMKRWCPTHEREVAAEELVKGWEVSKGRFVPIEDADLEAIQLESSQAIEIERFVRLEEVDPIYFDRTYYLAPASEPAARRPYVLLLNAMRETNMAAVGRFVLRGAEKVCLIRPYGDALALETLFLAEDIRSKAEIEEAVAGVEVKDAELDLARQVIASLAGEFEPNELLVSEYRRSLHELLEAKLQGEEIVAPEPVGEAPPVGDLMEALRASIAEAKKKPAPKEATRASKSPKKRAPAR